MADTKKAAPSTERALPNVTIQHRLNHMGYGNLGRVAYSPVETDDQSVGRLQTARLVDSGHHFEVLSHFSEVLPSNRSALQHELLHHKPSAAARSQTNWLLENHPEAVVGRGIDVRTLSDEFKALRTTAADDGPGAACSLLAVGEITDRTNVHSGAVGQPVIAMAAGEGRNTLRIVRLEQEAAAWPRLDLSVRLARLSTSARGDYAEDRVAMTLIKFAVDARRYDPIRWLLVQKPTGTTLLEPEINVIAVKGGISEYARTHSYSQMPLYISANPLFKITVGRTGGNTHVDTCFNPAMDGRFPQLAVIDDIGHWTVWDITGSRSATPKVLQPILTAQGHIDLSPLPSLRTELGQDPGTHKLLYVLPKGERRIKREYEQENAEHQHWGLGLRSPERCNHVLVCSDTDVRLYDATQGTQLAGIRVVNVGRAEIIVDMQRCPTSPSQAFVLTTSSLYWVDTKVARDGQASVIVISSHPHDRKPESGSLILSVSGLDTPVRPQSCAVFIISAQDKFVDMFICTNSTSEEVAHTVHQVLRADSPPSIVSLITTTLAIGHNDVDGKPGRGGASVLDPEGIRVFQPFALRSDLSLESAVFATSNRSLGGLGRPVASHRAKRSDKLRKKFLRLLGNAFVVPESYEDRLQASVSDAESKQHGPDVDQTPAKRLVAIDLRAACERLEEMVVGEIIPAKVSRQLLAGVIQRRGMEELGDSEHMRIRTLSELVGDKLNACNLDTLEDEWTQFREELPAAYEGKVQVSDLGGLSLPKDLQSLTWQLSSLSYVNGDTPDSYNENQRHLLRHLSAKQYLSLFGISVVPPPILPSSVMPSSAGSDDSDLRRATSVTDGDSIVPSSPTPSGTQSRHSEGQTEIDSDALPSRPDGGPLSRLRKYVDIPTNPRTTPLAQRSSTRLLSRWPATHTDPWSFVWEEDEGPLTAEDEEAMQKRRRRDEARRRRRSATQRLSLGLQPIEDDAGPRARFAATPRAAMSSQPRGPESLSQGQSQSQGQTPRPRISMSQVIPGAYGGRPGTTKKKPRKSIFR